jgi:hypothetical protein
VAEVEVKLMTVPWIPERMVDVPETVVRILPPEMVRP